MLDVWILGVKGNGNSEHELFSQQKRLPGTCCLELTPEARTVTWRPLQGTECSYLPYLVRRSPNDVFALLDPSLSVAPTDVGTFFLGGSFGLVGLFGDPCWPSVLAGNRDS